jgi:hypothetical protein
MVANPSSPEKCFLCRRTISYAPSTSLVEATVGPDAKSLLFHLNCFVAFTTGTLDKRDIWRYCIVPSSMQSGVLEV